MMDFAKLLMVAMLATAAAAAAPAFGKPPVAGPATGLTIEELAEQRVWSDEHSRWNARHLAAARRLEVIAATFRTNDSNFDLHGTKVRSHSTRLAGTDRSSAARAHAEMRAEHEEARSAHHHLMADVDALAVVMAEKFTESVVPPQR